MAILFAPLAPHLDLHVPRRPKADDADQDRVHRHEPPDEEGVRLDLFHVDELVPGEAAVEVAGIDVLVTGYGQAGSGHVRCETHETGQDILEEKPAMSRFLSHHVTKATIYLNTYAMSTGYVPSACQPWLG